MRSIKFVIEPTRVIRNVHHDAAQACERQRGDRAGIEGLFNGVIFENAAEVKASNGALIGQWYVQIDEPKGKFLDRYENRFPGASSFMSGNCYDIATLMIDSKRAEKDVWVYLKGVKDFEGAMGKLSVNSSNAFVLPATIKIVTESGFKKIGFTGEAL